MLTAPEPPRTKVETQGTGRRRPRDRTFPRRNKGAGGSLNGSAWPGISTVAAFGFRKLRERSQEGPVFWPTACEPYCNGNPSAMPPCPGVDHLWHAPCASLGDPFRDVPRRTSGRTQVPKLLEQLSGIAATNCPNKTPKTGFGAVASQNAQVVMVTCLPTCTRGWRPRLFRDCDSLSLNTEVIWEVQLRAVLDVSRAPELDPRSDDVFLKDASRGRRKNRGCSVDVGSIPESSGVITGLQLRFRRLERHLHRLRAARGAGDGHARRYASHCIQRPRASSTALLRRAGRRG